MINKYRNKKLLKLANKCPYCMACGVDNNNDIVAAHLNFDKSKGMGTKCHDYLIAYLCWKCHLLIDEGYSLTPEDKKELSQRAFLKTLNWLFTENHLTVK